MTAPPPSAPLPGKPVRGSTTGRPIMALFDLLGRRWTARVIWELGRADRPPTFRRLRAECSDMSSSVLTRRLRELSEAGLVRRDGEGYRLTPQGDALIAAMQPLLGWAEDWRPAKGD